MSGIEVLLGGAGMKKRLRNSEMWMSQHHYTKLLTAGRWDRQHLG